MSRQPHFDVATIKLPLVAAMAVLLNAWPALWWLAIEEAFSLSQHQYAQTPLLTLVKSEVAQAPA